MRGSMQNTFASAAVAIACTYSGKLLGHTEVAEPARYAYLPADPVKVAATQVSSVIAASIFSETSGNVSSPARVLRDR
jgi:hypothetical protein